MIVDVEEGEVEVEDEVEEILVGLIEGGQGRGNHNIDRVQGHA